MEAVLYVVILAAGDLTVTAEPEQCSESQEREAMYKFYMDKFCK